MTEAIAEWVERNPRIMLTLGMPLLLILGSVLLKNNVLRRICTDVAIAMMCTAVILTVIARKWDNLLWPCLGFIGWSVAAGIKKTFD